MTLKKTFLLSIISIIFFSNIDCMQQRRPQGPKTPISLSKNNTKNNTKNNKEPKCGCSDVIACLCCPMAACPFPVGMLFACSMGYIHHNDVVSQFINYFNGTQS